MNEKKSKCLISKKNQKETSVSSAPVDCYVPESKEHDSPHRVKQELFGESGSYDFSPKKLSDFLHAFCASVLLFGIATDFSWIYVFSFLHLIFFYFKKS